MRAAVGRSWMRCGSVRCTVLSKPNEGCDVGGRRRVTDLDCSRARSAKASGGTGRSNPTTEARIVFHGEARRMPGCRGL